MKKYCFDTSGISAALLARPEDIDDWVWKLVRELIEAGSIAVTVEIYDEMVHVPGQIGDCIRNHRDELVLEIGDSRWNWSRYVSIVRAMQLAHRSYISENIGGSPKTVGLNDISIIALAKALNLPLVSMERMIIGPNTKNQRIPNVCQHEGVQHFDFNDFLRAENARR
jgi:hypothetical protein